MKRFHFVAAVLSFGFSTLFAQPVRLKLPLQINMPNYNHFAPSLTTDGQTMIFASDYYVNDGNKVDMKLATSKGPDSWSNGEDVTVVNKSGTLNLYGAHCISGDGNTIYFTSKKTGGVGGYDIWVTEKRGGIWSIPQNLGKPVNSEGSDGFPSLSSDNKFLYFTRCQTMSNQGCESCKLLVSENKGQGIYKEPVEVPFNMHVFNPKIAKDCKTLIFSSNKAGGKGGYDFYWTQKNGEKWSTPQNMEFINTPIDEMYADIPAQGEVIMYTSATEGFLTMYRAKLAPNFHPDKIILLAGKTNRAGFIQISDNQTGTPISSSRIDNDGKLSAVLPLGKVYDVAVITSGNEYTYWSATYDATSLTKSRKEDVQAPLETIQKNKLYHANKPLFDTLSYQLLPGIALERKRLAKILQTHPDWKAEIVLFPAGLTTNPPADATATFESMKASFGTEWAKTPELAEKITYSNGSGTSEEENSYCGWGVKFY